MRHRPALRTRSAGHRMVRVDGGDLFPINSQGQLKRSRDSTALHRSALFEIRRQICGSRNKAVFLRTDQRHWFGIAIRDQPG